MPPMHKTKTVFITVLDCLTQRICISAALKIRLWNTVVTKQDSFNKVWGIMKSLKNET
jgi:hypothetical protein